MSLVDYIKAVTDFIAANDAETTSLIKELSALMQTLLDKIKCTSFISAEQIQPAIDILLKTFQLFHWLRKVTSGTTIAYLLQNNQSIISSTQNQQILDTVQKELASEKREVRDVAAQVVASLPQDCFLQFLNKIQLKDTDQFQYREALSVLCGYRFKTSNEEKLHEILRQNLAYQHQQQINVTYIHWYTQKALVKTILQKKQTDSIYQTIKLSFNIAEMKVRKTCAEAAGLFFATSKLGFDTLVQEVNQVKYENETELSFYTHTLLMAISVAFQVFTGTHISFKIKPYAMNQGENLVLIEKMQIIYAKLPYQFQNLKPLNGVYQNALITALLPEPQTIRDLLDQSDVMCLDGGINASIYMQRFFQQNIDIYKLQLLLCACYQSKAISVLALRALYYKQLANGEEINVNLLDFKNLTQQQLFDFIEMKCKSPNSDIRQAALKLLQQYFIQCKPNLQDMQQLTNVIAFVLSDKQKSHSMNALTAAGDVLPYFARMLTPEQVNQINELAEPLFIEGAECAGSFAKYFAVTRNKVICQYILIYAFDAVNVQMSEQCKLAAPVAARHYDAEAMSETVVKLLDENSLVLNGLTRMFHALRFQCGVEIQKETIDLCAQVSESAADFFDEVTSIYTAYLKVLQGKEANIKGYQFKSDSKIEFDQMAFETATLLKSAWEGKVKTQQQLGIESLVLSKNKVLNEQMRVKVQDIIYETTVQVELKQLIIGALLGTGEMLPEQKLLDVKKNEIFDFNKING